jgi:hypothetical protein
MRTGRTLLLEVPRTSVADEWFGRISPHRCTCWRSRCRLRGVCNPVAAINRFEQTTGHRSFKKFHSEQAIAFRRKMDDATRVRDGEPLSKATIHQTLNSLRSFMLWLAEQPGYRKRIR